MRSFLRKLPQSRKWTVPHGVRIFQSLEQQIWRRVLDSDRPAGLAFVLPTQSQASLLALLQVGGPIGLVQDGDIITIDVEKRAMNVELSEEELDRRRQEWTAPPLKATRGTLYKVSNLLTTGHGICCLCSIFRLCFLAGTRLSHCYIHVEYAGKLKGSIATHASDILIRNFHHHASCRRLVLRFAFLNSRRFCRLQYIKNVSSARYGCVTDE